MLPADHAKTFHDQCQALLGLTYWPVNVKQSFEYVLEVALLNGSPVRIADPLKTALPGCRPAGAKRLTEPAPQVTIQGTVEMERVSRPRVRDQAHRQHAPRGVLQVRDELVNEAAGVKS